MESKSKHVCDKEKDKQDTSVPKPHRLTTDVGIPLGPTLDSLTVGPSGPILLQDDIFIEEMSHFTRERIPERVVHARGAGAFGYFEVTNDITKYCKAKIFEKVGKKTPIAVRFSTTSGESGTADTVRDPLGFAVKFYTEDGNWDIVGNNTPVFFIRDPILFPSLTHAQKRNPQTHLKDANMLWDFFSLRPESLHELTRLFSPHGLSDGYRHTDGFGNHAFKLVNAAGKAVYCRFNYKTNQGLKFLTPEKAMALAGSDPDYALRDLYNAIARGDFPSWTLKIQIMTFEQAEKLPYNPFDITKIWYEEEFPEIEVGVLTLNRNPVNQFAEVEQIAFQVRNLVPGIEPSPDNMLHGRLFAYPDAQRYRLGVNFAQIPVNAPKNKVANYERDGFMTVGDNQGNAPSYKPNSFGGPEGNVKFEIKKFNLCADVARFNTRDEDNVLQVRRFYQKDLTEEERQSLCENIAESLHEAQPFIQKRAVKNFTDVDPDYGARVQAALDKLNAACGGKGEVQKPTKKPKHHQETQK
ncbi:catalase-like [Rhinophrynus dorsalis]